MYHKLSDMRAKWAGQPAASVIYLTGPGEAPKPAEPQINPTMRAYKKGCAARLAGKPQGACPYTSRTKYAAWRMGWTQTDRECAADTRRNMATRVDPAHVPGVWKNATTPYGSALLAHKVHARRSPRQKVADWCRSFKSKSGWKASDGRRSVGGAVMIS